VKVARTGDNTWTLASRTYPNNVAACIPNEDDPKIDVEREYYRMAFEVTVTLQ
jgi:hypothetical protein